MTDAEVAAVEFADAGADFPTAEIGDLGDGHAGADGVAELEGGQQHAPVHHVLVGVLLDVDVATGFGFEGHVLDVLAGEVGHDVGLILQGLLDGDASGGGSFLIGKVLGGLAEAVAGGFKEDFVLAGGDAGDGGIAAEFDLGELDIGLGGELGVLRLLVGGEGIGLGFEHLLLSFGEIGFGLLELKLLLGSIELGDDIARGDEFAGLAEGGDGHVGAADHGGGEHFGVTTLEFAAAGDGEGDAAVFDAGGGKFEGSGGGGGANDAHGAPGEGSEDCKGSEKNEDGAELHLPASCFPASTSVTMAPGWMPLMAISSGLRARTSTPAAR